MYTGFNTRPYTAFVISGMYAGLAGALLGSYRSFAKMQWTASGEVVLMTKFWSSLEWYSKISSLHSINLLTEIFSFLPDVLIEPVVGVVGLFVGEG